MDDVDLVRRTLALLKRRKLGLEHEIKRVVEGIAALENIERTVDLAAELPRRAREGPDLTLAGLSIPDAAARLLGEVGEPLHLYEIVARLQERGFRAEADRETLRMSLVSALARKARSKETFVATAPGTYGLRQWSEPPSPTEALNLLFESRRYASDETPTAPGTEDSDAADG